MPYQEYRGNSENKLFYIINDLYKGMNTEYSDDSSNDNEFDIMLNFDLSTTGSLVKRLGWGRVDSVSEILKKFEILPTSYLKNEDHPNPDSINDILLYMKLIKDDNNCFRRLMDYESYFDYQNLYGTQNNSFHILMITKKGNTTACYGWLLKVTIPEAEFDENNEQIDNIVCTLDRIELPVIFNGTRNLKNIDTIEFYDKIYFTSNNDGLVMFDRTKEEFSYFVANHENIENQAYVPNAMEVRKVGFNVLCNDPIHAVDHQGIVTESIQGIYLTTETNIPVLKIPNSGVFVLNILHTGTNKDFAITLSSGETELTVKKTYLANISTDNLSAYQIELGNIPTGEVELKIEKINAELEPYYDYYEIGTVDPEAKEVKTLNVGGHGIVEMYNRAVYYKDDTIWFSDINIFDYVPNYNYVTLPIEPTDKIVKIVYFKNIYVVFTQKTIYKMNGAFGESNFSIEPINLSIGCIAPNSVIPVENELYFVSTTGLYALVSSAYREGIENIKELDLNVKSLTAGKDIFDPEQTKEMVKLSGLTEHTTAFRYRDKYMLFANNEEYDSSYMNAFDYDVLVYDFNLKAFNVLRYKSKPTFIYQIGDKMLTYCSYAAREELIEQEQLFDYDFENIENGKLTDKSGNNLTAEILGAYERTLSLGANLDGQANYVKLPTDSSPFNMPFYISSNLIIDADATGKQPIFYYGKSSVMLPAKEHNKSGKILINTAMGTVLTLNYVISYNPNLYQQYGWTKGTLTYNLESDSTPDETNTKVTINISTSNKGDIGTITASPIKEGLLTAGSVDFDINEDLSIVDTIVFDTIIDYTVANPPTEGDTGSGASNAANSVEGYNGLSTRVTYSYSQNPSTLKTTISATLQLRRNIAGDTSFNGYASKTISIAGEQRYSGSGIDVRNYSVGTWYTVGTASKEISHNADGTLSNSSVRIAGSIATGLVEGTMSPSITINIPAIRIEPEYEDKQDVFSDNVNINLSSPIGKSLQAFGLSYDIDNNKFIFDVQSDTGNETLEKVIDKTYIGEVRFNLTYTGTSIVVVAGTDAYELGALTNATLDQTSRDNNYIGYNPIDGTFFKGNVKGYSVNIKDGIDYGDGDTNSYVVYYNYAFDEGEGTTIKDISGLASKNATLTGTWESVPCLALKNDGYVKLPLISDDYRFENGFTISFDIQLKNTMQGGTILKLSDNGYSAIEIRKVEGSDTLVCSSTSINFSTLKIELSNADLINRHVWTFECIKEQVGYTANLYRDGELMTSALFTNNAVTNVDRNTNYIGYDGNISLPLYVYGLGIIIAKSSSAEKIYEPALFENYKSFTDFGEYMDIELRTKGINLKYPMHIKKLKNVFIKGNGGFAYCEFLFELYSDGHIVNDPVKYYTEIEDGKVVYKYKVENYLTFDEIISSLGNYRLGKTKLGETAYQTKKIVIPAKGKNFYVHIKGESNQNLNIESLGFVFKLGKVKQD